MKKGRNPDLISLRDQKLIERYYYWTEIRRRRFDDVLKILSVEEFFIAEKTIEDLLRINNDKIQEFIDKHKGLKFKSVMFPV